MGAPAVKVENLWKEYSIAASRRFHNTFYDLLSTSLSSFPFGRKKRGGSQQRTDVAPKFWALRDINFEIQPGEVLGIIGRNGSGKSTLLKILSRITAPTHGRATVRGRVASLLEVGTGFHPELSGRENIYLNGAILGMGRTEISRKFDEIVEFAEVSKFIDTPVKRYSSGMYVRLAFAVAASLEPEVLVIDEVLAVGDAEFQRRCLGRMEDVAGQGRTVLFVSHNMSAVSRLCGRALWLDSGVLRLQGDCARVLDEYDKSVKSGVSRDRTSIQTSKKPAILCGLDVVGGAGVKNTSFDSGDACYFEIRGHSRAGLMNASIAVGIYDEEGRRLCLLDSDTLNVSFDFPAGDFSVVCGLSEIPLYPGRYFLNVALSQKGELIDAIERCAALNVGNKRFYLTGRLPRFGPLMLRHKWSIGSVAKTSSE